MHRWIVHTVLLSLLRGGMMEGTASAAECGSQNKASSSGTDEGAEPWTATTTTTTRTTRVIYMEEISEAGTIPPKSFPDPDDVMEETKLGESFKSNLSPGPADRKTPVSPVRAGGLSPILSPNLRKRSLGTLSPGPSKATTEPLVPMPVVKPKETQDTEANIGQAVADVEGADGGVKLSISDLDCSFKKKAAAISNAIIASRPIARPYDDLVTVSGHHKPPFRKAASNVGKVAIGFKGMVKSIHQTDELAAFTDTLMYTILKPVFIAMKISGIFFVRPKGVALFQNAHRRCFKSVSYGQMHCLFSLFILSVNCVRSFWAFSSADGFGYMLFFKLVWTILWYDSASRCLFFNVMWHAEKGGLQAFFLSLEKICYSDGIVPYEDGLRKTVRQLAVAMTCFGTVAFGSFAYGFFGSRELRYLFDTVLLPISSESTTHSNIVQLNYYIRICNIN